MNKVELRVLQEAIQSLENSMKYETTPDIPYDDMCEHDKSTYDTNEARKDLIKKLEK